MRKIVSSLLLPLALTLAGCEQVSIFEVDGTLDPDESSESGTDAPTQEEEEGDEISGTTFDRTITITWTDSAASKSGDDGGIVSIDGTVVTADNTGTDEKVEYVLSGSCSNGSFKLYSDRKQALRLNGLNLTNTSGAAINNQSGKRTFVVLEGQNYLYDSSSAAYAAVTSPDGKTSEDMKAVFFSEGQLVFSGSGSLTVEARNQQSKSCIASDDYIRMMAGEQEPTLKLTAGSKAGHGMRGKDYVRLSGGNLTVSTSAAMKKGITSEVFVLVEGGTTTITVSGGIGTEDGETKGSAGIKADNYFRMTGGTVNITNTGAGGKGIRTGSYDYVKEYEAAIADSEISGGSLTVKTTGSESSGKAPKAIKIGYKETVSGKTLSAGHLTVSGGDIAITTTGSGAEGIESKASLTFSGGNVAIESSRDDCINAAGAITFSGSNVYCYSAGNDAIDSNYGKSGAIVISGGVVIAHSARSPEEGLDCDNNAYIQFRGGTVFSSGGQQGGGGFPGGGGSSSSTPTCSQPVYYLQGTSVSTGWFTVTDSSGKVLLSAYVPRSLSGSYCFITSPEMVSGGTYKYGNLSSMPDGTSVWQNKYSEGGSATVSAGSWTAGSGYTAGGSSSGGGGGRPR